MTRVLFVDDDARVLSGLRRQLHDRRDAWAMEFAPGGPEAVERISSESFDAVVTDMKMPLVDGARVLEHVLSVGSDALRVVLSGEADPERRVDAASCAHRYLLKPCAPELLKLEIEQGLAVRAQVRSLGDERLARLWNHPPFTVPCGRQLLAALQSETIALPAALVQQLDADDSIWRRVRHALSAAWVDEVTLRSTPDELVAAVGARTVLSTAMAARVLELVDPGDGSHWTSALPLALATRTLARHQGLAAPAVSEAFLAALLHSVGAVDERPEVAAILAYVLPCWGFSQRVVDAAVGGPAALAAHGDGHPLAAVLAAREHILGAQGPALT